MFLKLLYYELINVIFKGLFLFFIGCGIFFIIVGKMLGIFFFVFVLIKIVVVELILKDVFICFNM